MPLSRAFRLYELICFTQFYLGTIALGFVVVAPYMSISRWRENFLPPNQHRVINSTWYSLFELIGAWGNTGMSLVDQNLVPFQQAYPLIIIVIIVAILGETGFVSRAPYRHDCSADCRVMNFVHSFM